ncbi:MAG: hypothetical protein KDK70_02885 [Myxococcales bacterium]|nr:hypothetical protein [Myxococcales bacterium]
MLLVLSLGGACNKNGAPAERAAAAKTEGPEGPAGEPKAEPGEPKAEASPPRPDLPAATGLLQKAALAMGSAEALAKVQSFYYRGTIEMKGQNIRGDLQIWWKGGDFFMEQVIPGIGEMRAGKRGDEIWAEDPINGPRRLSGIEAEQHAWASSLLLAAEWNRYFDTAQTVGERAVDGRTVYDVELSAASGLAVTMSFDAESGLQVAQSFEQVTPMGKQPFDVRFEDYREVEGVKLAFRQVIDAKVQQVIQEITEVKINAEVDESRFGYPHAGDVVRQPPAG